MTPSRRAALAEENARIQLEVDAVSTVLFDWLHMHPTITTLCCAVFRQQQLDCALALGAASTVGQRETRLVLSTPSTDSRCVCVLTAAF